MMKYKQNLKTIINIQQRSIQQLRLNSSTAATASTPEWQEARPFEEIPSMNSFSMARNLLPGGKYYKFDLTKLLLAIRNDLGPIVRSKAFMGRPPQVITHNPQDFETVFRNEGIWPIRPGGLASEYHRNTHRADFFQGVEGLVSVHGEKWGTFRTAVNPVLMQPKNVRVYVRKMAQVNNEFLQRIREIRDPKTFEVPASFQEEMNRWTLESVSVVALDKQLGLITTNRENPDIKELFQLINDFFTLGLDIEIKPAFWKYYKTPTFKKFMKTLDGLLNFGIKYVGEAIQRLEDERKRGVPEKPDNEKSVLEKLIKIDKKIATVMAIDMLLAGVDTTSSTLTGLLLCLAKNPEKPAKLRQEIMQILPEKHSEFTESSLNQLPYLRACIKEALRVYPITLGNTRVLANDVVLSGYRVPKGTQVSMVTTHIQQDDSHFPKAKEYLPERWLRSAKAEEETSNEAACPHALKASSPFVYLPFGFGPRSCVGRRIVEMELELGVARLVRNFHIEFNYPTENAFKFQLIFAPNIPLKFKFTDVEK
ncbi:cytochrome P450 CYP12A2 isoform X2 [Stomoxys calcitrans]|uniref:cytochrome P450 CYP12A2 isoform X2 n=1 Tax=Stomoxys calcitrans TaxID=35570 RepID=UPI0027E2ACE1|nr:cytochrome P450 CYP12A2 isoform X2 [Stomoxys calcitrans]